MGAFDTSSPSGIVDNRSKVILDESAWPSMNKDTTPHSTTKDRSCQPPHPEVSTTQAKITFSDLPAEIRVMIWEYALPDSRVFNALVYASAGLKMQLLERSSLRMPIAHVCFESRQVVLKAGYRLAFRDEDEPDDPGVFFHPRKDVIERTLWGPGDFWGLK
ncbi:hypothetical protein F5Y02DRAFT_415775 [Annulohypoxylon stygium]|nr:hypothetical protein F5Y02DRAFT_415775 [Annulohypoxylon stygium]